MTAPEVTVPTASPLQRVPNVELMHAGTWNASTGKHTFTADDFANASAANDCPAVRRPILKLGHVDPRFDGEPAIGYVDHVRVAEDGHALVGDFAGMPGWLTPEVMASAWPDRSIEGEWDFTCALGHSHGFVVTAVALLGVSPPAIGTLQSFQDIAVLYAVGDNAEITEDGTVPTGKVTLNAPGSVSLSVTSEDIRRAFYDRDDVAWSSWVEEIQLSPELQVIVHDDTTNQRSRVPVTVDSGADGTAAVSFGEAVPVVVRYEDVASPVAASAGAGKRVMFSSRAQSRTNVQASQEDPPMTTLNEALAAHLGVDADADDAALIAALESRGNAAPAAPPVAPAVPGTTDEPAPPVTPVETTPPAVQASAGVVTLDESTYSELRRSAQLGAQAYERQITEDRERVISEAVRAGKFAPARADHFRALLAADPEGGRATIDSLSPGLIPVDEMGHNHGSAAASAGNDDVMEDPRFKAWSI